MKIYQKKFPGKSPRKPEGPSPLHKVMMPILLFVFALGPSLGPNTARAESAANLIGNPDLETTMIVPAIWNRGGFGENTASFSYPQTGVDGSRAVRVDMTAYTSGDAKWYFDDVPVKPSTQYTFSDSSFSDVPTSIDIRYKTTVDTSEEMNTGGKFKFRYIKLGDVPAQSSATVKQFTFTTPPNAVSLTIFHYIDRVGYLVTDNYSLMENGADTTTPTDTTAPVVLINTPLAGATVSGTTTVSVTGTDNVGVTSNNLFVDGVSTASLGASSPTTFSWNTTALADGVHTLYAVAADSAGNMATSSAVSVTVQNTTTTTDTIAPTVSITSPLAGATISGTTTVSVNATDNVGVAGVSLMLDGTMVTTEDTVAPYSFDWNTVGVTNGTHMLTAKARDAAGNMATSSAVSVNISN